MSLRTPTKALAAAIVAASLLACDTNTMSQPNLRSAGSSSFDASPSSVFFTDALTGPTSPNLVISPSYSYTADGLMRTTSNGQYTDRPQSFTVSGAYLAAGNFTAQITVNLPNKDIVFFGLGQGTADPSYVGEPSNAFEFRIHNWDGYYGMQAAVEPTGGRFLANHDIGPYQGGPVTVVIKRHNDDITLSVPSLGTSQTYSLSQYQAALGLNNSNTYLYFGNTFDGTVFSNFSVQPDVDDAMPPSISSVTPSITTIWSPNGKYVPVTVSVNATGAPAPSCAISSVSSNEDAVRAGPEWQITGPLAVSLRAERQGSGNGRVYTIAVTCSNSAGSATATTTVSVPHDQGQ
jgi:hypothetical protein